MPFVDLNYENEGKFASASMGNMQYTYTGKSENSIIERYG